MLKKRKYYDSIVYSYCNSYLIMMVTVIINWHSSMPGMGADLQFCCLENIQQNYWGDLSNMLEYFIENVFLCQYNGLNFPAHTTRNFGTGWSWPFYGLEFCWKVKARPLLCVDQNKLCQAMCDRLEMSRLGSMWSQLIGYSLVPQSIIFFLRKWGEFKEESQVCKACSKVIVSGILLRCVIDSLNACIKKS